MLTYLCVLAARAGIFPRDKWLDTPPDMKWVQQQEPAKQVATRVLNAATARIGDPGTMCGFLSHLQGCQLEDLGIQRAIQISDHWAVRHFLTSEYITCCKQYQCSLEPQPSKFTRSSNTTSSSWLVCFTASLLPVSFPSSSNYSFARQPGPVATTNVRSLCENLDWRWGILS